jgi:DNA-binding transcriptional MerR regulator
MEGNYFTRHVVKKTGIHNDLVREYSRILEMNGYSIRKDAQGKRCYTLKDIRLLQKIHKEQRETLIDLDEVITQILEEINTPPLTPIPHELNNSILAQTKKIEEFFDKMNRISEQNNEIIHLNHLLLEEYKKQDKALATMEETMEKRSHKHDAQLMRIIREIQVTKRSAAATKERPWVKGLKSLFVKQT